MQNTFIISVISYFRTDNQGFYPGEQVYDRKFVDFKVYAPSDSSTKEKAAIILEQIKQKKIETAQKFYVRGEPQTLIRVDVIFRGQWLIRNHNKEQTYETRKIQMVLLQSGWKYPTEEKWVKLNSLGEILNTTLLQQKEFGGF